MDTKDKDCCKICGLTTDWESSDSIQTCDDCRGIFKKFLSCDTKSSGSKEMKLCEPRVQIDEDYDNEPANSEVSVSAQKDNKLKGA